MTMMTMVTHCFLANPERAWCHSCVANAVLRAPSCVPLRPHTCNLTTTHQLKANTVLRVLDLDGNDVPLSFGEDAAELLERGDGQADDKRQQTFEGIS